MTFEEVGKLFERIKHNYSIFAYNDGKLKEWHKVLKNFDSKEVNNNFDNYIENNEQPPIIFSLIRGLQKIEQDQEDKIDYMKCEYCGKLMMVINKNMEDFLTHERKCQKIDFINRMSEEYRNKKINKSIYYSMGEEELENNYRQIMNFYVSNRTEDVQIIKRVEEC